MKTLVLISEVSGVVISLLRSKGRWMACNSLGWVRHKEEFWQQ